MTYRVTDGENTGVPAVPMMDRATPPIDPAEDSAKFDLR